MKRKKVLQISFRTMTVAILIATLPFFVLILSKKFGSQRNLASEVLADKSPNNDLSELSAEEFNKAFKYEVLRAAAIEENQNGLGIRLGAFFIKDNENNKVSFCDEYPMMDLLFVADGVAFSGEIPQMVVRGPCTMNEDKTIIQPLVIPFAKILTSPPQQYEALNAYTTDQGVQIYFKNIVGYWPPEWSWNGVIFHHKDFEKKLEINGYETISVLGAPLILQANE